MDSIIRHTGSAVALRRSNVDTDQIIPAVYLKRVTKTGFEDGLFAAWRNDPSFVLNQPEHAGATILVPGPDFGTGSSREHAVWALQNYGFAVVIGSRFGDIFRSNSGKAGLLIAIVDQAVVEQIQDTIEADPAVAVTVDLTDQSIVVGPAGSPVLTSTFEIDGYTRWRLMEGLDDIGLTLRHVEDISAYEAGRPTFKPATIPVRVAETV